MTLSSVESSRRALSPIVQGRVILALILREVHTIYGDARLGYLWAVIKTVFGIAVFWVFRELMRAHAPHGMSTAMFLLCGFIPCQLFIDTVSRCLTAVSANQALLTYPQVTELDLMISRAVVVWATQIVSGTIILIIALTLGQSVVLRDFSALYSLLIFAPLIALGTGVFFASLSRFVPVISRITPLFLRMLFLASGVFFQVSELPSRLSQILLINPVAQLIEWLRYGFSASSAAPSYSLGYIVTWAFLPLCLGMLLERHARGREIK